MSDNPYTTIIDAQANPDKPEAIEFYRWLGMCVGAWAFVDRRLYQIFHHSTGLEPSQSAFIFYRNRAFNQRLRLADDAMKMFWPKERYKDEWRPLYDMVEDLSHTRNIFAHHPTIRYATANQNGTPRDVFLIYIEPYERVLNNDYPGLLGKNALDVDDLKQHDTDLTKLEKQLQDFAWRVGGERAALKTRPANNSPSPKETSGK